MARVLIIDNDPAMAQVMSSLCAEVGHTAVVYSSASKALNLLSSHAPQLVIAQSNAGSAGELEVLKMCRASLPHVPVILLTGNKSVPEAVAAMRAGAADYLLKPFHLGELKEAMQRALSAGEGSFFVPSAKVREGLGFENMIGSSARMQNIFELIGKVARTDSTILISGESGTGKELVARALHFNSGRRNQPFVAINCSALPENLLESELFGHKKGSFTGAVQDKVGLFEEAEGGTIFLDEINSMAALLQTKLLRVLQERVIRRVGENRNIPIHVRVLAASNEPLFDKMKAGGFREDLYYRLAVIPLEVPPLRERREDIPLLVEHFLQKHTLPGSLNRLATLDQLAMQALCSYGWPGNVRELENAVERACALCENGVVQLGDLPPHVVTSEPFSSAAAGSHSQIYARAASLSSEALPIGRPLSEFIVAQERRFIEETIRANRGVRERAAQVLGISSATLYRKLDAASMPPIQKVADAP
jgi:two-component system, NtrC family, response regulator AtoC